MPDYRVLWEIDIAAETPTEAARLAYKWLTDPESSLPVMEVRKPDGDYEAVDLQQLDATEDFCDTGIATGKGGVTYRISFAYADVPLTLLEELKPALISHALTTAEQSLQQSNLPGGTGKFVSTVPGRPERLELPCVWYVVTPDTITE